MNRQTTAIDAADVLEETRPRRFPPYPKYKPSGVDWLGDVPEHWEVKRLKDCGSLQGGVGFPHEEQGVAGESLPFYKVADLVRSSDGRTMGLPENSISYDTARGLRAKVIPPDSIVYAKIGAALLLNRRRISALPCCIDNNMTAYTPHPDYVSSSWAFYWLTIIDFGVLANPGAVPSLSEGDQATIPIIAPPLPEQQAIVAFWDRETAKIVKLVAGMPSSISGEGKLTQFVSLLHEYRLALISAAVMGKIDVRGEVVE